MKHQIVTTDGIFTRNPKTGHYVHDDAETKYAWLRAWIIKRWPYGYVAAVFIALGIAGWGWLS